MTRNAALDALRGLMLVSMTLTHLPTAASRWSSQPLGFVSNAEGFVFLSAFLVGAIYGSRGELGFMELARRLGRRVARLYGCHLLVLAFAFTFCASIALTGNRPHLANLLDFYLASPTQALFDSLVLIYRPPLMDILPMYILFMAATPVILTGGGRRGWAAILGASALVWLAAQAGLRAWMHDALGTLPGHPLPALRHMGAFNLYAWQALWIFGLWLGSLHARNPGFLRRLPTLWITVAVIVAATFLCLRYAIGGVPAAAFGLSQALSKWNLGPLRVIDFAALVLICARYGPALFARLPTTALQCLGRASLPVFTTHVLVCLLALCLPRAEGQAFAPVVQLLLLLFAFAVLFAVAAVHKRGPWSRSNRKPATAAQA